MDMDDAVEYLEHLKNEWDEVSPEIKTGSPVIDDHFDGKAEEEAKRKADSVSVGFSLSAEYEVKCI